jgi:hemerythrin-like domain-containing protein
MFNKENQHRRSFLKTTGLLVGGAILKPPTLLQAMSPAQGPAGEDEGEISPAEDLMREHGVLKRVLLVYDEISRRLATHRTDVSPDILAGAAGIIRTFIEDYHEKLEEDYLFPRFEKAGKLVDLVSILRLQHQRGRALTDLIVRDATIKTMHGRDGSKRLIRRLHRFVRMYNPHEAREDTVLFPALHSIVSSNEYDALGEDFEKKEHELFGEEGFEKYVGKVADLEKQLDIYDLARFTLEGE